MIGGTPFKKTSKRVSDECLGMNMSLQVAKGCSKIGRPPSLFQGGRSHKKSMVPSSNALGNPQIELYSWENQLSMDDVPANHL